MKDDAEDTVAPEGVGALSPSSSCRSSSFPCINPHGDISWRNNEQVYHRVNGPAVQNANGTEVWFIDDIIHRERGPALMYPNGEKQWWRHGELIKVYRHGRWIRYK